MLSVPDDMVLYAGACRTILFARTAAGGLPVKEFLETQEASDSESRRLKHLIKVLGDVGHISNATKFKKLKGSDPWEFRVGNLRVLAWPVGPYCLLLRAARKQAWKLRRSDLEAAERLARWNIELIVRRR